MPLSALNGVGKTVTGFVMQDALGAAQPALYVDDIAFTSTASVTPTPTATP